MNLKYNDFLAWLNTQPHAIKFAQGSDCDCPIAKYVQSQIPDKVVSVMEGWMSPGYRIELGEFKYDTDPEVFEDLPEWVEIFIKQFDDWRDERGYAPSYISKETAIDITEKVQELI